MLAHSRNYGIHYLMHIYSTRKANSDSGKATLKEQHINAISPSLMILIVATYI